MPRMRHMGRGRSAVPIQRVKTARCGNDVEQSAAILVLEDDGDLLESVIDLPAGLLAPDEGVVVTDDAVGFKLVPCQGE